MKPVMVVLAGPNGAGKSTLYQMRVAPAFAGPFINADLIQRDELCDPALPAAYTAARIADERRAECLAAGLGFVTETVFSHAAKLELIGRAQEHGFIVIVMHVGVADAALSVARVAARVGEGGHPVPEEKVRARHDRGGPLIRQAVLLADRGLVFDNSRLNEPPVHCLAFTGGRLTMALPVLPAWVQRAYAAQLVV